MLRALAAGLKAWRIRRKCNFARVLHAVDGRGRHPLGVDEGPLLRAGHRPSLSIIGSPATMKVTRCARAATAWCSQPASST